ncbi:hypothetical protein ACSXCS_04510 [Clostridium perfringens]
MKKIIVNSYYFFPENTPRAFRATELVKELIRNNFYVIVVLPNHYRKYEDIINDNLNIKNLIFCGEINNNVNSEIESYKNKKNIPLKKYISKVIRYTLSEKNIFYSIINYKYMKNLNEKFDCIISIGLPFSIHIGTYLFAKKLDIKIIGDYGDPFSSNPAIKLAPYFKLIEKRILKRFDYITIPTKESEKYYKNILNNMNKINIIPQGFDFSNIKISKYIKNDKCKFAYAGLFYEKIRNPKELFCKLCEIEESFEFNIYTDLNNYENMKCLENIPCKIRDKVKIHGLLPREECIYELSKFEFLINIENSNSGQKASKVIDYALTNRPILNLSSNFDISVLKDFINGNYEKSLNIDLSEYDIKNVFNKFKFLIEAED